METLETMTYEVTGRIARITLNRPDRGNGITGAMSRELADCVERADLTQRSMSWPYRAMARGFAAVTIWWPARKGWGAVLQKELRGKN